MFVTHGADLHSLIPLTVSLGEELYHDAIRPLPIKLQWFGGVAQVSTVDHVLQNLWRDTLSGTRPGGFFSRLGCAVSLMLSRLRATLTVKWQAVRER